MWRFDGIWADLRGLRPVWSGSAAEPRGIQTEWERKGELCDEYAKSC